jgi:hypothetical protein
VNLYRSKSHRRASSGVSGLVDDATEDTRTQQRASTRATGSIGWRLYVGWSLLSGLVGPVCVVVPLVFGKDMASVCLVEDQQVVAYFAAQCLDHSFAVCVHPWRAGCGGENAYAVRAEHLVEGGGVFAVTVAKQEA